MPATDSATHPDSSEDVARRPFVVLVGPPGAGKSTVGGILARRLSVEYVDTDDLIEKSTGTSIPDIFLTEGEERFRVYEHHAVDAALHSVPGIVSLGGGAVLHPETREVLREHTVVFLDVSLARAMPRVGLTGARPLLVGSPRARWKELMDARRPLYTEVARLTVQTDELTPGQVAAEVIRELGLVEPGQR